MNKISQKNISKELEVHFARNGIKIVPLKKTESTTKDYRTLEVKAMDSLVSVITLNLQQEQTVQIKGLGTFKTTTLKERQHFNPSTKTLHMVKGKKKVKFTPSKNLNENLI